MFHAIFVCILGSAFVVLVTMAIVLARRLRLFVSKPRAVLTRPLNEIPSVSVCIPARNETHAMTECLERVISSDYPKLEIIVLDDESKDNTSMLIKAFAHTGVRFVEGSPLPEDWLGKNHALNGLYQEASGHYIVFLDVDTHIQPRTISNLVGYAMNEDAAMISVLPQRIAQWRISTLFSDLRYLWTVVLHRTHRPAASSSLWMIKRSALETAGGIESYKQSVRPEAHIASRLSQSGLYRFMISVPTLGVTIEKRYSSLVETSVRVLYPFFGGTILTTLVTLAVFSVLLVPYLVLFALPFLPLDLGIVAWSLAGMVIVAAGMVYTLYLWAVWPKGAFLGVVLWPFVLFQEFGLLIVSSYRYKRGLITWKGRSVRRS